MRRKERKTRADRPASQTDQLPCLLPACLPASTQRPKFLCNALNVRSYLTLCSCQAAGEGLKKDAVKIRAFETLYIPAGLKEEERWKERRGYGGVRWRELIVEEENEHDIKRNRKIGRRKSSRGRNKNRRRKNYEDEKL